MNALRKAKKKKVLISNGTVGNIQETAKQKLFEVSCYNDDKQIDQSQILLIEKTNRQKKARQQHINAFPSRYKPFKGSGFAFFDKEVYNIIKNKPQSVYKNNNHYNNESSNFSDADKNAKRQCKLQICFVNTIQSNKVFVASKTCSPVYCATTPSSNLIKIKVSNRTQTLPSQPNKFIFSNTTFGSFKYTCSPQEDRRYSLGEKTRGGLIATNYSMSCKQKYKKLKQRIKRSLFHYAEKEDGQNKLN